MLVDGDGNPVRDEFEIFPDNTRAAELLLRCQTQWRRCSMSGQLLGLDYHGVLAVLQFLGETPSPELFDELQLIERGALGEKPNFPELDELNIIRVEFDDGEGI